MVQKIHQAQQSMMNKRQEILKKSLDAKYENRMEQKREKRFKIQQDIEELELTEKALMEELSRTTQKRNERKDKINEINQSFYSTGIFNSKKKLNLSLDQSLDETHFETHPNSKSPINKTKTIENSQKFNLEEEPEKV